MKKDVMVSRGHTGLFVYVTEEVAKVLGGLDSRVTIEKNSDHSFDIKKDPNSKSGVCRSNGQYPYRIVFGNGHLRFKGYDYDRFGPTQATWSVSGLGIHVKLPDELHEPTKKNSRKAVAMVRDPFDKLRDHVYQMNELMEEFRSMGVTFFAEVADDNGGGTELLQITGKISGQRVIKEEF